jgi:TM2 domain-containing membrane protein YozV
MKQRDRLAASLLAFFLGGFGGHWFYLGRRDWGRWYLTGWLLSWALTPIFVGWVGVMVVGCLCLYDFVHLIAMEPAEFEARYN